uniref:autotransporter outer membrane beta-barrel domain-containing protein n=1 Tax=Legionella gresilensis TaxID=91823 RepID=UPI0031F42014
MLLKKSIWNVSAITPLLLSFSTITYAASNLQALPDELLSPNLLPSISSMSLYNQAKIESNNFQSNFFASFNWSPGASDSNWFNPNNWIPNTLPGPADDVFISIATEFNPVIAGGGIATVNSVTVDGPGSFLTGIPSLLVRDNGVLNSNVIAIGQSFIGIMEISNGGLVTADVVNIGGANSSPGFTGSGIVVVTDAGSKLSANQIYIGNSGNGALTIINGAVVQDNRAFIAEEVGSAGTVTVSGANSQWNNTSYIRVGNRGNGNLSILDGGSVTVSDAIIGNNQSSVGSVNVSGATPFGASTLTSQTYIAVGSFGNGTLNISNGGLVYSVDGVIGANSGGTGVVNVENTGGWGISNTLFIGYSGNGTLTINPGGTVNTSTTYIGLNTGSIGALNLNGELFQNGTLITGQLVGGLGNKLANFNGGTLVASASTPNFIINFNPGELNLQNTDNFLVNSLTINSNGFDIGTSNAVFSGTGGLAKVGAGTLTLTGNHSYTGQTLVASGGLIVDGNLQSPVYVGTSFSAFGDTYLGGTGTVGATTVAGKIAPGHPTDSIATTLTVNGDYTQLGGSIYAVNVNTNQADLISIAGTATLNPNSAVQLFPLNPIIGNYTILHANQGLSGTYSNPILPNFLPFLNFTLSYTPQDVILNITRSGTLFASFARTRNQASVAQALESLAPAHNLAPPHSLHTAFVQLSHPTEIQNALDDLSGELYASTLAAR